jgi:hypothetical protein
VRPSDVLKITTEIKFNGRRGDDRVKTLRIRLKQFTNIA